MVRGVGERGYDVAQDFRSVSELMDLKCFGSIQSVIKPASKGQGPFKTTGFPGAPDTDSDPETPKFHAPPSSPPNSDRSADRPDTSGHGVE